MSEFIAILDPYELTKPGNFGLLKRILVLFNRVGMNVELKSLFDSTTDLPPASVGAQLRWLYEKGLLYETKLDPESGFSHPEFKHYMELGKEHRNRMMYAFIEPDIEGSSRDVKELPELRVLLQTLMLPQEIIDTRLNSESVERYRRLSTAYFTRSCAIQLRVLHNIDAFPVLTTPLVEAETNVKARSAAIKFTLNALPTPDETVSLEQIVEFRSDPDSTSKFLALRNWINEIGRTGMCEIEIEQKLEFLLDDYAKHMQLHRMKISSGKLETILTTTAEVIGNLATFNLGKATKAVFEYKKQKVALLEGERTSPGREIAYLFKAKEKFK